MTKQNKTEKQLWPYIVISFAIVFAIAVVIQHWTNTEPETVSSNDIIQSNSIENIVEKYQEVDDADVVEEIEVVDADATETAESFGEAFKKARTEKGIGQSFVWEGKEFTTYLADEGKVNAEELITTPDENVLPPIGNNVDGELVENGTIEVSELVENQEINQDSE